MDLQISNIFFHPCSIPDRIIHVYPLLWVAMAMPVSCPRGTLVHSLRWNPKRESVVRRDHIIHNIRCSASVNATGADTVRVTFKCGSHPVEFGQKVAVVSNVGEWKSENAVSLDWKEGDVWEGDYEVPSGINVLEFKLVTVASGDVEGAMEVLEWEESDNKVLEISQASVVECAWNSSEVSVEVAKKPKKPKKKRASTKKTSEQEETVIAQDVVVEEEIPNSTPAVASPEEQPSPQQENVEVAPPTALDPEPVVLQVEEHNDPPPMDQLQVNDQNDMIFYSFDDDDGQGESAADMAKRMYGG